MVQKPTNLPASLLLHSGLCWPSPYPMQEGSLLADQDFDEDGLMILFLPSKGEGLTEQISKEVSRI